MHPRTMSARQTQIVDAAIRILATRGSRRLTAQALADEIGVTPGAIFRHFDSMEAIADAVVERTGAMLFEGFPPEAADPVERLGLFFRRRARTILANPRLSRLLLSEHLAQAAGEAQAARLEDFRRRSRDFVAGCLKEAGQRGVLAVDTDPDAATVMVLGSILALSHAGSRIVSAARFEHLTEAVWAALERALRGAPAAAAGPPPSPRRVRRKAHAKE